MRIALFTETFLPKVDGIVHTLLRLLDRLAASGHEALLFAPAGGPPRCARTRVIGLPAYSFPAYPELRLVPPTIDLRAPLRAFAPDLVHLVGPVSLGVAGLRAASEIGAPVIASYHTDVPGFAARWGFGWLAPPLWRYFRWLHNRVDLTVAPSRVTRDELLSRGIERVAVWSRGVDTERFTPERRSQDVRWRLTGGHPDAPLLLFVGRLSPEKRVDWLRPVIDVVPGARLAIVGDGPARPALEALFAGTPCLFTGYLRGTELAAAYASADLFVFPAANETFGNVVLEAMASGVPVVAPRSGGLRDYVEDGRTGVLFEPEERGALAMAARWLLNDRGFARELAGAGLRLARARTWSRALDELFGHYEALIGSSLRTAA
jgi:glycosyltransferase involved in cell wall biosynthesis